MFESKTGVLCCGVLLACASAASFGQQAVKDYPSRPIRVAVPFVPGGTMDFIGHNLAPKLARALGQNLFVDNRSGAGGAIGTDAVAKSPPDGYTILLMSSGHTSLPSVSKNLPYDPVKDFAPITLAVRNVGNLLIIHPSVPARSVQQLIALAKAHPGKLSYGSGGVGHVMHFSAESFNMMAGIRMMHVPYKGLGQAMIDLIAGRIELTFSSTATGLPHVRSGKLRVLGISAPARWSELPDVPTIAESGLKGYAYLVWYGLWFPAGVPADYVTRIRAEVIKAFEDAGTERRFVEEGLIPVVSTPQEFSQTIVEGIELHRRLAARMGLTAQ